MVMTALMKVVKEVLEMKEVFHQVKNKKLNVKSASNNKLQSIEK
jgi:hypothetical protein